MRNGVCPKCGSETVHTGENGVGGVRGIDLLLGWGAQPEHVISYLCTTCGYFENYFTDQHKLAEVAAKWPRVPPQ